MLNTRNEPYLEEVLDKMIALWQPANYDGFQKNADAIFLLIQKQEQSVKDILVSSIFDRYSSFFNEKDSDLFLQLFSELSEEKRSYFALKYKLYQYRVYCKDPSRSAYYRHPSSNGMSHQREIHSSSIAKIAALLPEKDRMRFANAHFYFFKNSRSSELSYFIPLISSDQQLEFLNLYSKKVDNGRDLEPILKNLRGKNAYKFLKQYINKINDPDEISYLRISVYQAICYLSEEDAYKIAEHCIDRIPVDEFNKVLTLLPPNKRLNYLEKYLFSRVSDDPLMELYFEKYIEALPIDDRKVTLEKYKKFIFNNLEKEINYDSPWSLINCISVSRNSLFATENSDTQSSNTSQQAVKIPGLTNNK